MSKPVCKVKSLAEPSATICRAHEDDDRGQLSVRAAAAPPDEQGARAVSLEGEHAERKSLRLVTGNSSDWSDIARTCVCLANGSGGRLLLGIEDGQIAPPPAQRVTVELVDAVHKRVGELSVNVHVRPSLQQHDNGGEFVEVIVQRAVGVASTADGRYLLRVGDTCVPVLGDDVGRLLTDRPGRPWETIDSGVRVSAADRLALQTLTTRLRESVRVRPSVRQKSDEELLVHYGLAAAGALTHLGVLLVGMPTDRRALGTAPIVQVLKYDDRRQRINKWVWDDYTLSPIELVDAVWAEIPDFRETYEVPAGLYRPTVPAYDDVVVRELLVNALVHRPYTQRGDIFLNLHPDRLEVVNPGRLPVGVTTSNILHATLRRNEGLAHVFHDLELMEREGSGIDLVYERLLSQGRPLPLVVETADRVSVTVQRRIVRPELLRLIAEADERYQLSQREHITLGLLGQGEGLTARELASALQTDTGSLKAWLGRLVELELVRTAGRTAATRYFVSPPLLKDVGLVTPTSLARIEMHRLVALVREDLARYPRSAIGEVHARIGSEIPRRQLRRAMARLVASGEVLHEGAKRSSRYRVSGT
jgi:ATP-dependent DNA helicase RecG